MAKLKCDKHKRRVLALDGKFIHRTGDGTRCDSPTAKIGGVDIDVHLATVPADV